MLKAALLELGELRLFNFDVDSNMSELNANLARSASNEDSESEGPPITQIKCNVQKCNSPIKNMIIHLKEAMDSQIGNELKNEQIDNRRPNNSDARRYHDAKAGFKDLEAVRIKMGVFAIPFREGVMEDYCMVFDSGTPSKFWLYADTSALAEMQQIIQVLTLLKLLTRAITRLWARKSPKYYSLRRHRFSPCYHNHMF